MINFKNQDDEVGYSSGKNNFLTYVYLFLIAVFLILIAGFRPIGFDRDSLNYLESFNGFTGLLDSNYLDKEPTFWVISWLSNLISAGDARILFIIYAVLYVLISLVSIVKITPYPLVAIFCYMFLFFPLHGMTQIRAGLACAFFLSSIPNVVERKSGQFFIKSVLAVMFHYSAIVIFFVYFLKPKKINIKFYFLLPLIGLFFVFFKNQFIDILGSITSLLPDFLSYKLLMYLELLQDGVGEDINLFSIYYTSLFVMYYYLIFNVRKFDGKYDYILIKLLGWTLFSYYFFSFLPAIAVRVSEFYGVVVIFIIPMLIYSFRRRVLHLFYFILFVLLIFVNNVFVHGLFNF